MFLHPDIIYGPVRSRRLGYSLGLNLLPPEKKICSFECIYCECGWTNTRAHGTFPGITAFSEALEATLKTLHEHSRIPDHITFSGNGEPTLHPDFGVVMDITVRLRNLWAPASKIAVLSNGTTLSNRGMIDALMKADKRIFKLDAGTETTFRAINIPESSVGFQSIIASLKGFNGHCVIQSMFLQGEHEGRHMDNSENCEIEAWLDLITLIDPESVMVYSLDRNPPSKGIKSIHRGKLDDIAKRVRALSIDCSVY